MNRPQGHGKWVYPSGDKCEGLFDKGKATGKCIYTFANGDCYRGNMKHGKAHGVGGVAFLLLLFKLKKNILLLKSLAKKHSRTGHITRVIFIGTCTMERDFLCIARKTRNFEELKTAPGGEEK